MKVNEEEEEEIENTRWASLLYQKKYRKTFK